jgi:hypothetical protein
MRPSRPRNTGGKMPLKAQLSARFAAVSVGTMSCNNPGIRAWRKRARLGCDSSDAACFHCYFRSQGPAVADWNCWKRPIF